MVRSFYQTLQVKWQEEKFNFLLGQKAHQNYSNKIYETAIN